MSVGQPTTTAQKTMHSVTYRKQINVTRTFKVLSKTDTLNLGICHYVFLYWVAVWLTDGLDLRSYSNVGHG